MTSVSQVGTDRIIEIQFSEGRYRLFLEFYAAGNIVLTDNDLKILALFRIVPEGADQEELRLGLTYVLDHRQNYNGVSDLTEGRLRESLKNAVDKVDIEHDIDLPGKQTKLKNHHTLRKALLVSLKEFSPVLIDHALRASDFDPTAKAQDILTDDALFSRLLSALTETQKLIEEVMKSSVLKGFIIAKPQKPAASYPDKQKGVSLDPSSEIKESWLYEEYHPFIPQQYVDNSEVKVIELDGFNHTVDEFYSSLEAQHVQSRLSERDENAKRKLEAARQDHEKRLDRLQETQQTHYLKAQALEANLQGVQDAMGALNGLIAQGMGWVEIERLIEMEQAKHNSIAEMIKLPLKLYQNTITLLLKPPSFAEEDDFAGNESDSSVSDDEVDQAEKESALHTADLSESRLVIDVDLGLSPWSNARLYYEQKKTAAVKEQKTLHASAKALKSTERKINADLNKALKQEKAVLRPVRQPFWFEKFIYFISSEGYLVLGGRDMLQNEILYSRFLRKGDIYVHADLHGAASIVVRNKTGLSQSPIPPSTLAEAGTLAVVTSSAWDSKAVMSAWWVPADEVTKTSTTGDYLPPGEFAIRGQKRFLPPAQLLLGFGVMFHISDESKARHFKHRILTTTTSNPDALSQEGKSGDANRTGNEETDGQDKSAIQEGSSANHLDSGGDSETSLDFETPSRPDTEEHDTQPSHLRNSNLFQGSAARAEAQAVNAITVDLVPGLRNVTFASKVRDKLSSRQEVDDYSGQHEKSEKSDHPPPATYQSSAADESDTIEEVNKPEIKQSLSTSQIEEVEQPKEIPNVASTANRNSSGLAVRVQQKQPVRGKKGKIKKAKEKYGDQDEDDRKAALRLLGSVAAQEKAEQDALARAARDQELGAQKERRQRQLIQVAEKGREAEQLRQMKFQAEIDLPDAEDVESAVDLEALVGTLLPGDEVLDAFVVCGPWNSIGSRCRWKAKLQPGAIKKGKIVREILARWSSEITEQEKRKARRDVSEPAKNEESTENKERELLKSFKEQEIVGVVPVSRCRVVMGTAKIMEGKMKDTAQRKGASHKRSKGGKQ